MRIAAVGDRDPAHLSHREIDVALALMPAAVEREWVASDEPRLAQLLPDLDGVWLLPGSPYRDEQAVRGVIRHCLAEGIPFLGTCAGFQYACIELARAGGAGEPAHAETEPDAPEPLIAPLACTLYGEPRTVTPVPGTLLAEICGEQPFEGFHWCGYGLNESRLGAVLRSGARVGARAPDAGVEAIELPSHPFFVATAFQPQVGSSARGRLHPLLGALLDAARPSR